jgi:EmrB/QacA subfamily drug resistance transporter
MPPWRRWTLVATIIGSSLAFIDATVVNVALPALQTALHASLTEVQWIVEAYALFLSALMLVGGSAGDQFGRRRLFLVGVIVFTAASAACGVVGSARALIAARAVQGIGAALLVPCSLAIVTATFDGAERGRAIGIWSGFTAITSALGPVGGGWFIDHVSWRAVFFLNLPLAAVVVWLTLAHVRESRDPSRTRRIDGEGAALATLGLGLIVFALLEWPRRGGSAPLVAAALTVGLACLVLFVVVERRSPQPMLSLELFRSRAFSLTNALTLLLYGSLSIVLFLVPMNLIEVQQYTATEAGAALLPFPLIMFGLSRWSGGLVARIGSRIPLTVGPAIAAVGTALYARPAIGGSYWTTFFPATVVLGCGMAVTVAPLTTTVMGSVDSRHAGVASGINNAVSRVAGLLAIALFGVLLAGAFRARVDAELDRIRVAPPARAAIDRELPRMAAADLSSVSMSPAQRVPVRASIDRAFVSAFRRVMIAAAALALIASLIGAMVPSRVQSST